MRRKSNILKKKMHNYCNFRVKLFKKIKSIDIKFIKKSRNHNKSK